MSKSCLCYQRLHRTSQLSHNKEPRLQNRVMHPRSTWQRKQCNGLCHSSHSVQRQLQFSRLPILHCTWALHWFIYKMHTKFCSWWTCGCQLFLCFLVYVGKNILKYLPISFGKVGSLFLWKTHHCILTGSVEQVVTQLPPELTEWDTGILREALGIEDSLA